MKRFLLLILAVICIQSVSLANEYKTACANHILVSTEKEAMEIKEKINSFDDFKYFAKEFSSCPSSADGGNLGCFQKGQMVKSFEQATFENNTKEVIGPIKTEFGYHLIWVRSKF